MNRASRIVNLESVYRRGLTGKGIVVATLDSGISLHPDLNNRIKCFMDICNGKNRPYDDNGHGTHIAGIIAGNGEKSSGHYRGIAPEAGLVIVKVLDRRGNGHTEDMIKGIRWCITNRKKLGIRIINISVGMLPSAKENEKHRLLLEVQRAWQSGIVVVTAAGNNGPASKSITIPGTSPWVITVGSYDDHSDTLRYGMHKGYSGAGPTEECIQKPEILAPGTGIVSCSRYGGYEIRSGTSMATPMVSGAIALLLQSEPGLTPAQVKLKIYNSGKKVDNISKAKQGWGLMDIERLIYGKRREA